MGDDEADEGDRTGRGRRGAREQDDGQADEDPVARGVPAEPGGHLLAEREGVEGAAEGEREDDAHGEDRRQHHELVSWRLADAGLGTVKGGTLAMA